MRYLFDMPTSLLNPATSNVIPLRSPFQLALHREQLTIERDRSIEQLNAQMEEMQLLQSAHSKLKVQLQKCYSPELADEVSNLGELLRGLCIAEIAEEQHSLCQIISLSDYRLSRELA